MSSGICSIQLYRVHIFLIPFFKVEISLLTVGFPTGVHIHPYSLVTHFISIFLHHSLIHMSYIKTIVVCMMAPRLFFTMHVFYCLVQLYILVSLLENRLTYRFLIYHPLG